MSKVIDLSSRRQSSSTATTSALSDNSKLGSGAETFTDSFIVDFESQKKMMDQKERRTRTRTVLNEMMSSMVVIPERGLLKVTLHDISTEGLSFDTMVDEGAFAPGEEVSLRIYINHKTYFPVCVTVKHVSEKSAQGTLRHGAILKKDATNDVVLQYFVKFVEAASDLMKKDNGDLMVNKIS